LDDSLIVAAVALLVIAGFAQWMDRRRNDRDHLDKVGWVNWPLVMILALIGAVMLVILAAKL
jgi:hypothetical protein